MTASYPSTAPSRGPSTSKRAVSTTKRPSEGGECYEVARLAELKMLVRDTVLNFLGATLPILITLVTVPIYLRAVGNARYGVLTLVWLIVGYFGLFDLGLGRATINALAKLRDGPIERKTEVFWSGLLANLALGCIAGLVAWVILRAYPSKFLGVPEDLESELVRALPYLAFAVPATSVSSVLVGALESHRDFWSANAVGLAGSTMSSLLPLIVAFTIGRQLPGLVGAAVIGRTLAGIGGLWACYRAGVFRGVRLAALQDVQKLLRYGAWISVSSMVGPILASIDRLVIASVLGAHMVPYYTIPFSVVSRVQVLASSLQRSLFPRFSSSAGDQAREVARKSLVALAGLMTPLMALVAVLLEPFLGIWIGPDYSHYSAPVGVILVLGMWVNSLAFVPYSLLQAEGRPDLTAKFHLLELIPYIGALTIGVNTLGLEGAAAAWSLRGVGDAILLFMAARLGPTAARTQWLPACILVASCLLGWVLPRSLVPRIAVGSLVAGVSAAWGWRVAHRRLQDVLGDGV